MTQMLLTHDPRTGTAVARHACTDATQIDQICQRARQAFFQHWRTLPAARRSEALLSVARHLREQLEAFAAAEAADTGKSLATARGEVAGAAGLWEYAAALARVEHTETLGSATGSGLALTLREPMGVVGLIVPWNYPLITTAERMPFALAAGCCVILKPSELAVGSLALLVAHLQQNPLFPADVVQVVYGVGKEAGQALTRHPAVDMIAFVGSTATGRAIETAAASCGKRVTAELGGNNQVLVYPDADLAAAADGVIAGALRNGGQACIAGTHVLVDPAVADEFVSQLQQALQRRFPASSSDAVPEGLQPMITLAHKQRIQALVQAGLAQGGVALPGSRLDGPGHFLGPVLVDHVAPDSALREQELFGPVITICRVAASQFNAIVADNQYGLAVYVWTAASSTALQAVRQLRVGRIWVNADPEFWLPELPVGGFADSGVGREGGIRALDTYSLPKAAIIY